MFSLLLAVCYLAFISLGLPDSVLGAAWPTMYPELNAPISGAGVLAMVSSGGTIVSSLLSDRLTRRFGAGLITAVSVGMTAAALFGFSVASSYWMLLLLSIPYGLGAGSVDSALNNFCAIHCPSRHLNWIHCMWGVGTVIGPLIMGNILTGGGSWRGGYTVLTVIQVVFTAILFLSLPLWRQKGLETPVAEMEGDKPLSLGQIFRIPGAAEGALFFFAYCSAETAIGLWASSYLVLHGGLTEEAAASAASLFYLGITLGRFFAGFLSIRLTDGQLIHLSEAMMVAGGVLLLLPLGTGVSMVAIVLFGLGCAPVFPTALHATPTRFGVHRSQAVIGVEVASAYVGCCLAPPVFGLIAQYISETLLPVYVLAFTALLIWMNERMIHKTGK